MLSERQAYICGYSQALEEFTVRLCDAINRDNIELSDKKVDAYHKDILQVLDYQRVHAVRALGLYEFKTNPIFKETDYDQITTN